MASKTPAGNWFHDPQMDSDYSFFVKNATLRRCSTDKCFRDFWIQCTLVNAALGLLVNGYAMWWWCGLLCPDPRIRNEVPFFAGLTFFVFQLLGSRVHIAARHRPRAALATMAFMLLLVALTPPSLDWWLFKRPL